MARRRHASLRFAHDAVACDAARAGSTPHSHQDRGVTESTGNSKAFKAVAAPTQEAPLKNMSPNPIARFDDVLDAIIEDERAAIMHRIRNQILDDLVSDD